jgi:thiamine biosynthesis lipoprotein
VSTSGDYERYFIDQESGERIHHILHPGTGKSANEVMSVTILGERGINTDPLSTTVFVLGVEKGIALVNSLHDFDAIIIDRRGKVHYSEGLAPGE